MSIFVKLKPPYNRQALLDLNSELASYGLESYNFDFNLELWLWFITVVTAI